MAEVFVAAAEVMVVARGNVSRSLHPRCIHRHAPEVIAGRNKKRSAVAAAKSAVAGFVRRCGDEVDQAAVW